MKINFAKFFRQLWDLIIGKTKPVEPPVIEPPVIIPPEPPVTPVFNLKNFIAKLPKVVAVYFGIGDRWEEQTVGWLYREMMPFVNTIRYGGWDNDKSRATLETKLEALWRTVFTVASEFPFKYWIVVADILEGYDPVDVLKKQLLPFKQVWDKVVWIEVIDEPHRSELGKDEWIKRCQYYREAMNQLGLEQRPLLCTCDDVDMTQDIWSIFDIVALEGYVPPPGKTRIENKQYLYDNLTRQIAQLGLYKPLVIVPKAYANAIGEGWDWKSIPNLQDVFWQGVKLAKLNNALGIVSFSYARPSGAREIGKKMTGQLKRAYTYITLGIDDGPVADPEGSDIPLPEDNGPGKIQPVRKATMTAPGSNTIGIELWRDKGSQGNVSCAYHTEDSTGKNGIHYLAKQGIVSFKDGETNTYIDITLLPNLTPEGTWEAQIYLSNPINGAVIVDDFMRFGAWSNSNTVGFTAPLIKGTKGNSHRITVRRDGNISYALTAKVSALPDTALDGRDFDKIKERELYFAADQREAYFQVNLKADAVSLTKIKLVINSVSVDKISPTTGTSYLEIH